MKLARLSLFLALAVGGGRVAHSQPAPPEQPKPDQPTPDAPPADPSAEEPPETTPEEDRQGFGAFLSESQSATPGSQLQNVFRLLEEEADVKSVVATKVAQRSADAPAVVEVITANQILAAGYQSVAEALARIPGIAVNSDYVFDNVGVRGLSGGLRAGARHIKVLIDGQPIAFRSDAQNFLGPELIPLSAIERIEVLRGPASALYGLNAYLGVVNIVTKKVGADGIGDHSFTAIGARGENAPHFGGSAEMFGMDKIGALSFMLAAHATYDNRSGLKLPASGPNYADFDPNARSRNDVSRPLSLFGSVDYDAAKAGKFTLTGNYQQKNARGEFVDYGAFSHVTQINLQNWFARLGHDVGFDPIRVTSYAAYSDGGPLDDDVIQPVIGTQPLAYRVKRNFGYSAIDVGTQATVTLFEESIVLAGAEYTYDREEIRTNTFISNTTDVQSEGGTPVVEPFTNAAGYAQALYRELGWLQLSGNIRYDYSNQFGSNINYRGGIVLAPVEEVRVKLLSGSSYRGPTPEQLFGRPVAPGDVIGSLVASDPRALEPQTALIHEAALNYDFTSENTTLRSQVGTFYMQANDRIEFLLEAGQFRPQNTAQSTSVGGEFSMSLLQNRIADFMSVSLSGSVSYSRTNIDLAEANLTDREVERLKIVELYPTWMVKSQLLVQIPTWYLRFYAQVNAYSERLQSQINQSFDRPFVGLPPYTIGRSYPVDIAISTVGLQLLSNKETFLQLAVKDVLNSESEQPGFSGVNLPPLGRRYLIVLKQDF